MGLDIVLAASAREWPDRLHRHVLDHGGARVSGRVMSATQCLEADYGVVFIDDVCSFLTPRLVAMLRDQGKLVVGVYDAIDSPDAKRRLLECGISDVIESQAHAEEFLELARSSRSVIVELNVPPQREMLQARTIGVVGVTGGVGATELAVTLAYTASRRSDVCLVDLDPVWPSVAQRLDLPPHPNLRSVVDAVLHEGDIDAATHVSGSMVVVAGSPWHRSADPIPNHELSMVLESLSNRCEVLVTDLGSEEHTQSVVVRGFDTVVIVGVADPIGVGRLMRVAEHVSDFLDPQQIVLVVNKTPRHGYHRAEIRSELAATLPELPLVLLPTDDRVYDAGWDGKPTPNGIYRREVSRIADLVVESKR